MDVMNIEEMIIAIVRCTESVLADAARLEVLGRGVRDLYSIICCNLLRLRHHVWSLRLRFHGKFIVCN